jgi:hypothetical protein
LITAMMLIQPSRIAGLMLCAVAVLVVMHGIVIACYLQIACVASQALINDFGYLFDMNRETNIPAWFSSGQLLCVAFLLLLIMLNARRMGASSLPWALMTALFTYLSMDEATDFHGLWAGLVDAEALMGKEKAGFAWMLPGVVIVAIVGLLALRWVWQLPHRTRGFFILAGIVYVTGGLGFELLGSLVVDETFYNPAYLVVSTLEEALEMCGVIIMLVGVVDYLQVMDWRQDTVAEADAMLHDPRATGR